MGKKDGEREGGRASCDLIELFSVSACFVSVHLFFCLFTSLALMIMIRRVPAFHRHQGLRAHFFHFSFLPIFSDASQSHTTLIPLCPLPGSPTRAQK